MGCNYTDRWQQLKSVNQRRLLEKEPPATRLGPAPPSGCHMHLIQSCVIGSWAVNPTTPFHFTSALSKNLLDKGQGEMAPSSTRRLTCFPSKVYNLLTAPESNLMASVMSVSTWSKECAVFLLSSILTALRGLTPLRMTVTSLGLMKSLASRRCSPFGEVRDERERDELVLLTTAQLGLVFLV